MRVLWEPSPDPVWQIRLESGEDLVAEQDVSLDGEGLDALERALAHAEEASHCRALVIRGTPTVFCRGVDVRAVLQDAEGDHPASVAAFARCLGRIRGMSPVVICVVDGEAKGGGVGLAAAADLAIAGPEATFSLPELRVGLVPAVILPVLRERVGAARVRWLALTGASLNAREAERIGLVDEVVETERTVERTIDRTLRRLLRARPESVGALKRLIRDTATLALEPAMQAGVERTAKDLNDPEVLTALRGLAAGDLPPWFARPRRRP